MFEDHYRVKSLIHSDPPDHTRLRALVTKAFSPRLVEAMRPRIQAIVNGLLDSVQGREQMDVIRDLAVPLPVTVLAEIFGAPASDQMLFKGWADDLLAFQGLNKPSEETLARSQKAVVEIRGYLARGSSRRGGASPAKTSSASSWPPRPRAASYRNRNC